MRSLTLLCVEDEPDLLADLVEELQLAGYSVHAATNGADALHILRTVSVDIVLCDVQVPQVSGPEILATVRDQQGAGSAPPFVFLTAYGDDALRHLGLETGHCRVMVKPIDFDDLIDTIEQVATEAGARA